MNKYGVALTSKQWNSICFEESCKEILKNINISTKDDTKANQWDGNLSPKICHDDEIKNEKKISSDDINKKQSHLNDNDNWETLFYGK